MKTKKLIKALKTIRKFCKKHSFCKRCPLGEIDEYCDCVYCGIDNISPDNWDIAKIEEQLKDKE